jgi:heat shock protein HtpX
MLAAHGLYGHIRNNDLRAAALLGGFALFVGLLWLAVCLLFAGIGFDLRIVETQLDTGRQLGVPHWLFGLETAARVAIDYAWIPVLVLAGWLAYAWLKRKELVREGTGAHAMPRSFEPGLYNMVEALAIAAGLPAPAIEIIETNALNAYASGWSPADSSVTVTRGLLGSLSPDELEAVLAHEITHIRYRDVRLMTVAGVFVGFLLSGGRLLGAGKDGADSRNLAIRTSGGAGLFFALGAAIIGVLAGVLAVLSQLALSRSREFVADAGAVALTKNPDALIRALEKISTNGDMPAIPDNLCPMLIFSEPRGWWASHPSIESRIRALETYAGGRRTVAESRRRSASAGFRAMAKPEDPPSLANPHPRPFGRRVPAQ